MEPVEEPKQVESKVIIKCTVPIETKKEEPAIITTLANPPEKQREPIIPMVRERVTWPVPIKSKARVTMKTLEAKIPA